MQPPPHPPPPQWSLRALSPRVLLAGTVVAGFGRGSKELGVPTANLDVGALGAALDKIAPGIYFGWASVGDDTRTYEMVMSIGWNPFYKNERKTVEAHLLHSFSDDFYGAHMRLVVAGYLRDEAPFASLDALIEAIRTDIRLARESLGAGGAFALDADADSTEFLATAVPRRLESEGV